MKRYELPASLGDVSLLEQRLRTLFDKLSRDAQARTESARVTARGYVAKPWEVVMCDPSAAAFEVTIPDPTDPTVAGTEIVVKNNSASANTITIRALGGRLIDGATTATISAARGTKRLWASAKTAQWVVL